MRSLCIVFIAAALTVLLRPGAHAQSTLEKSQRDEIALVPDNDPDMATAFRKARETLDGFLAKVRDPHPSITAYAVKIPVSDGGQREFFWISRFEKRGGRLIGRIDNTPRLVHNIKQGERITFKPSDVVDWLYLENGKMVGNFTACVIIKRDTPQDAEAFKRHYGLTCEP